MNKKNIFSFLTAAMLLGASAPMLTSCEDTLDKPSYTADDLDFVFSDEGKAELFVKGCYRSLVYSELWRPFIDPGVTLSCEEDLVGGRPRSANFAYDVILPATATTVYSQSYKTIESCNIALERLAGLPETDKRNALIAEVTFIRAFAYNELIRFYGDVPAIYTPISSEPDETWYPKRSDRDGIYDRIIGEMQACVDDLPWFSESDYGSAPERLTRQAAKGILARICLYAGGYSLRWNTETNDASTLHMGRRDDEARVRELYTIADNALKEVIEHGENSLIQNTSSMSGYQTLFYNYCQRNFGVTSQEMMWHIASLGESTNFDFSIYNGQPGCMGGTYGSRKTLQVKLPTYYLSFAANDTRRDVTCANYSITFLSDATNFDGSNCATTFSSIMPGKFRIQWCQAPYAAAKRNVDVPLLRYADVLLMYAETQNYLNNGPTGAAISALQEVRDRAGISSMPIASGSHDEFLETIMQERKWELGDELVVRGDLIRTNLIEKEIRQDQQDIKDLSDRTGKYADVAPIRLVKLEMSSCTYGEKFLTVPFIEITDADEIALLSPTPQVNTASNRNKFKAKVNQVLAAHGITPEENEAWYAVKMFEAWTSTYNKNARRCAGYTPAAVTALNIGASIYTKPLGRAENNGEYPEWVAGKTGIYYGFEKNKTELCPFAAKSAGHPLIDNPNLTQHPAYK